MKIIALLIAISCMSACAVQSTSTKETLPIKYHAHFYGAQDDLSADHPRTTEVDVLNLIGHDGHIVKFPLTYAIACNQAKTDCKHAVVKTDLEFTTQNLNNKTIKVSCVLHSEMGRALTTTMSSSSGMSTKHSMSVPDVVSIIGENRVNQTFEKTLLLNEKIELKGLAGVHVDLDFQQHTN